ncbi:MAG: hypothetical protein WCI73_07840 [Phycisphaerae bacterium]
MDTPGRWAQICGGIMVVLMFPGLQWPFVIMIVGGMLILWGLKDEIIHTMPTVTVVKERQREES